MALTRLFVHDTFYDATDNFTYTPGMRLTLDNTTQSARITRLQNSGVVSTDETIDPSGVAITGGNIDGTVIGATTAAAGTFTTITVDTTTLVTDATNNRVGIGTASPSQALDVSGIVQATRFYIDDGNAVIERDSGALNLQTFAGNHILMQPGGNVGIGTTNPDNLLDLRPIAYSSNQLGGVSLQTTGGELRWNINIGTNSVGSGFFRIDEPTGATGNTQPILEHIADTWYFKTAGSDRLTISSGGNVGIGTTSPDAVLHANSGATNLVAKFESTDATVTLAMVDNTTTTTGNGPNVLVRTGDTTSIYAGGTERITILGAGNVGVAEGSPDYRLDVNGTFGFTPGTSVTPVDNGDVVFEATNNTTFTVKLKGTDGTVRSGTLTLA